MSINQNHTISRRDKLALTVALGGLTLGLFGLGASASFTATTAAQQDVVSGTVDVGLGVADSAANRLTIDATNIAPGDTIERAVDLTNLGSLDLASLSLTTTAPVTSKLDTDPLDGLQMTVESCSVPWAEAGTAPGYTYTCAGAQTTLIASGPVIGASRDLAGVDALTSGSTSHLKVELNLPKSADNTFQGLSSTVDYTFDAVQRSATSR